METEDAVWVCWYVNGFVIGYMKGTETGLRDFADWFPDDIIMVIDEVPLSEVTTHLVTESIR